MGGCLCNGFTRFDWLVTGKTDWFYVVVFWDMASLWLERLILCHGVSGLNKSLDCTDCVGGMACDQNGLTYPLRPCAPGYYCRSGAMTTTPTQGQFQAREIQVQGKECFDHFYIVLFLCSWADSLHSCCMWSWMSDHPFIAHFECSLKCCTYSAVWLLDWCCVKLLHSACSVYTIESWWTKLIWNMD